MALPASMTGSANLLLAVEGFRDTQSRLVTLQSVRALCRSCAIVSGPLTSRGYSVFGTSPFWPE